MKTLKTLIKLNKNKLDVILRKLDYLESEKLRLEQKKQSLEEEADNEVKKHSGTPYAYMLERYMQHFRQTIKRVEAQIHQHNLEIELLRQNLRDQYAELKKFEIALERKKQVEIERQRKSEVKALDEFSTNKFIYSEPPRGKPHGIKSASRVQ
ncbi:MAG: flagellar export protein FliJ, partial [Rickettsiaceae bacterium]|nr:flagellar export protein FliJ [Rickettsiaceae bacterium]